MKDSPDKIVPCWIVASVLALTGCAGKSGKVSDRPALSGTTLDHRTVSSDDFRGKVLVVDFWATWCPPCVESIPHLKALYEMYKDQGLALVGVSADDDPALPTKFVADHQIPWPIIMDTNGLSDAWGVESIPHLFILGPDGQVLWSGNPERADKPLAEAMKKFGQPVTAARN